MGFLLMRNKFLSNPYMPLWLGLLFCLFFGLIFLEIAREIWIEKQSLPFDVVLSNSMGDDSAKHDEFLVTILTLLGNSIALTILTLLAGGYLFYRRFYPESAVLIAGFFSSAASVYIFKYLVQRGRPMPDPSIIEHAMAFPSGHSTLSLFVYGFLAYVIARRLRNKKAAFLVIILGIILPILIGISRLYLNVHWLSDVVGGFMLGAAFLCLTIGVLEAWRAYLLQRS
jgi:undecaprenyl-diphosphatase